MELADDGDARMEIVFDREWALRLIQSAFAKVEAEFRESGREGEFEVLRRFLPGVDVPITYAEAVGLLQKSEGTVMVRSIGCASSIGRRCAPRWRAPCPPRMRWMTSWLICTGCSLCPGARWHEFLQPFGGNGELPAEERTLAPGQSTTPP